MYSDRLYSRGAHHRYSAKRMLRPVNFYCIAPEATQVALIGDFNQWQPDAHPMKRGVDGSWVLQVPLHHGHHRYKFLVDGEPRLDPRAHGTARTAKHERVSVIAVS
jgi:1,4-alpha-glucan branching enzyme